MTDQELEELVERIFKRTERELGYSAAGYRMMLNAFVKSRPQDMRTFLRVVKAECVGVNLG